MFSLIVANRFFKECNHCKYKKTNKYIYILKQKNYIKIIIGFHYNKCMLYKCCTFDGNPSMSKYYRKNIACSQAVSKKKKKIVGLSGDLMNGETWRFMTMVLSYTVDSF